MSCIALEQVLAPLEAGAEALPEYYRRQSRSTA